MLVELFTKGEETLAKQLAEFYLASQAISDTSETSCHFQFNPPITAELVGTNTINQPIIMSAAPPLTKMQRILAARYAPLVLPNPLHAMPTGDYQKYMPKFTRDGDVTVEEHIEAFYSYA